MAADRERIGHGLEQERGSQSFASEAKKIGHEQQTSTWQSTSCRTRKQINIMVEEDKDVDTLENKGVDASEKKPRWNRRMPKASSSTPDVGGKEKFEGASDEMKGNVFSTGRNQADVFATTMNALIIRVGIQYSATVLATVRELKVRPTILKIPVTPEFSEAISRRNTGYRNNSSTDKHGGLV